MASRAQKLDSPSTGLEEGYHENTIAYFLYYSMLYHLNGLWWWKLKTEKMSGKLSSTALTAVVQIVCYAVEQAYLFIIYLLKALTAVDQLLLLLRWWAGIFINLLFIY